MPLGPLPFRFCRDDELIDDRLRAIGKIAELRFPQAEHSWVIERVAVIKPEHGSFREQAVVNANARLFFGQVHEWHVGSARLRIVKDRVPRAEGSARTILSRQSDRNSFQQQRSEGERFGIMPFIEAALFKDLALMIEDDAFDLRLNLETFWHAGQTIDNGLERFLADRTSAPTCLCIPAEISRSIP